MNRITYKCNGSPQRDEASLHFEDQALSSEAPGLHYVPLFGDDHQSDIAGEAKHIGDCHQFTVGDVAKPLVLAQSD